MSGDQVEQRSKPSQSKETDEDVATKNQIAEQRSKPSQSKEADEEGGTKNRIAEQRSKPSQSKEVDEEGGSKNQITGVLFDDDSIRAGFVRKVFLLLIAMLIVNIAMCAAVPVFLLPIMLKPPYYKKCLRSSDPNASVYLASLSAFAENTHFRHSWRDKEAGDTVIFMTTYFVLVCFHSAARNFPLNITLLVIFTLAAGVLLMALCASVPPHTVLLALIATAVTCVGIIAYASQTAFDITSKIFIVYAVTLVVFVFGICIAIASNFVHIRFLGVVFSAIVCILFMVHLALDIQMILGGRKYELSPEEYIYATLMLFVDIYEIFVSLVDLVDAAR